MKAHCEEICILTTQLNFLTQCNFSQNTSSTGSLFVSAAKSL